MARYTGPKHKLARREGVNVLDKQSASLLRRLTIKPGIHGGKRGRKLSEYGLQLREKQKAKAVYGLLEKQFHSTFQKVQHIKGNTGELFLGLLETRLDNIVYRLGFAKSRFMARQFVSHGHVLINGKKVTIPSYQVKADEVVTLSDKVQKNPDVVTLLGENKPLLPFLEREAVAGRLLRLPKRTDVEVPFDMQLIIEYYSR
ncbi:MAG TPA: 30S ribosomal protein S4 [Patescibacteria group bacterium]|nr:30S ribosomal protein S4 [Patescibacteria group bacterium]